MSQVYGTGGSITVKMAGPFGGSGGGTYTRIAEITLPASEWKGGESPYSQIVETDSVSIRSKVDLQLSVEQTEAVHRDGVAFTVENDEGEITVYAIGNKPTEDYIIQATVTEVVA